MFHILYQTIHHLQHQWSQGQYNYDIYIKLVQHGAICPNPLGNIGKLSGMVILVNIEGRKGIPRGKVSIAPPGFTFLDI